MFATYTLEVVMDDYTENSSGKRSTNNRNSSSSSRRQEDSPTTLIAAATSIKITMEQSSDGSSQQFLAALVPHDMVEASVRRTIFDRKQSRFGSGTEAMMDSKCLWLEQPDRVRLSRDLLPRIHSVFTNNNNKNSNYHREQQQKQQSNQFILIRAIFSTTRLAQHSPADVVLLDLPPTHGNTLSPAEYLQEMNGESMVENPSAILKLLIISQVHIASSPMGDIMTQLEIPLCPVCLHRIDPVRLGLPKPLNSHLCSKFCPSPTNEPDELLQATTAPTGHIIPDSTSTTTAGCPKQRFLRPWKEPSHCVTCRVIRDYQTVGATHQISAVFCNQCALHKTLWVCLTCGFRGCGRYSNKHAEAHFLESGHNYSLELATLRIWDYSSGEFAHRGDLLECPAGKQQRARALQQQQAMAASLMAEVPSTAAATAAAFGGEEGRRPSTSNNSSSSDILWENQQPYYWNDQGDEKSPKKAIMIGEEYEALLQSALEEQAQHYEGEISRLRAVLTAEQVDMDSLTAEETASIENLRTEIAELRTELDQVGRQLLDAQAQEAGYRVDSQRLLREQQVAQDLLKTIQEETKHEQEQGKRQMEELEQQIEDLTANLRMRHQFSQDQELTNAHIFGTVSSPTDEARAAQNSKKGKLRRLFRK